MIFVFYAISSSMWGRATSILLKYGAQWIIKIYLVQSAINTTSIKRFKNLKTFVNYGYETWNLIGRKKYNQDITLIFFA